MANSTGKFSSFTSFVLIFSTFASNARMHITVKAASRFKMRPLAGKFQSSSQSFSKIQDSGVIIVNPGTSYLCAVEAITSGITRLRQFVFIF